MRAKWRKVVTGSENTRIRDHLIEHQEEPQYVKFFDKVAFTLGVLNIVICQFFLLNRPEYFWLWYSTAIPILMLARSPLFFKLCFTFANGPVTWAIVVWRSSLVFHENDKMTSVYIHILPGMLFYTLRWHVGQNSHESYKIHDFFIALLGYLIWQLFYFIKTEIIDKEKLDKNPNLQTSLRHLSTDVKNYSANKTLKLCRKLGIMKENEKFDSKKYYIEIFSQRYQLQFEKKQQIQEVARVAAEVAYEVASQSLSRHMASEKTEKNDSSQFSEKRSYSFHNIEEKPTVPLGSVIAREGAIMSPNEEYSDTNNNNHHTNHHDNDNDNGLVHPSSIIDESNNGNSNEYSEDYDSDYDMSSMLKEWIDAEAKEIIYAATNAFVEDVIRRSTDDTHEGISFHNPNRDTSTSTATATETSMTPPSPIFPDDEQDQHVYINNDSCDIGDYDTTDNNSNSNSNINGNSTTDDFISLKED
eukprot:gene10786-22515_t